MIRNPEQREREMNEPTLTFKVVPRNSEVPNQPRDKVKSVCIIARHPGPAAFFSPLISDFLAAGLEVTAIVTEQATTRIKAFAHEQNLELVTLGQPPFVEWALISGDNPPTFELTQLQQLKAVNKDLRIGLAEDSPGSVTKMIESLVAVNLLPALITTTTRNQATEYRELLKQLRPDLTLPTVIPIGQPAFDNLKQKYAELRLPSRNKILELAQIPDHEPAQLKLISFIGIPEDDFPPIATASNTGLPYQDLNSTALAMALEAILAQAQMSPYLRFAFIYIPHYRSNKLKHHPYLSSFTSLLEQKKITNLQLIYHDQASLKENGLTTQAVCAASDLVINTLSTIGQELGVVKAQTQDIDSPSSILILPQDYFDTFRENKAIYAQDASLSQTTLELYAGAMRLKKAGAATVITSADQALPVVKQVLEQKEATVEKVEQFDTLRSQYRLQSPATPKMLRWMRATQSPRTRNNPLPPAGL
jgi:hypothetical protein